jgi:hypothetical protein
MALNDIMGGGQYDAFQQGQAQQQEQLQSLLKSQQMQAQLPGIQGQSQQQAAAGQLAQANMPQKIAQQSTDLNTKQTTDKLTQLQNFGSLTSQFGAVLNQVPPPARAQALTNFGAKIGIPEDHPIMQGLLSKDPNDMPQALSDMGTKIQQSTQAYIQQQALQQTKNAGTSNVAGIKAASAENVATTKADTSITVAGMNNTSKESIAANALKLKQVMFDNKVVSPDQLVAKRTQEYQANPTPEAKEALDQANQIATSLANNKGLFQAFQQANTTSSLLPGVVNTIPQPGANPVANFPTPGQAPIAKPAPQASPQLPPGVPPGSTVVGTSGGKPVYKDPQGKMWQ